MANSCKQAGYSSLSNCFRTRNSFRFRKVDFLGHLQCSVLKDRIYRIMDVAAKKNIGVQEAFKWLEKKLQ